MQHAHISLQKSFEELDIANLEENSTRSYRAFWKWQEILDSKANDWGAWDEALNYIHGQNPNFAKDNFTDVVMGGLKINLLAYLDPQLNIVDVKDYDAEKNIVSDINLEDAPFLNKNHPLIVNSEDKSFFGVVLYKSMPAIAIARKISKGDGSGPPAGRVIFLKSVDVNFMSSVSREVLLEVSFEKNGEVHDKAPVEKNLENQGTLRVFLNNALTCFPLISMTGENLGFFKINLTRKIMMFGREKTNQFLSFYLFFTLTVLFGIYYFYSKNKLDNEFNKLILVHNKLSEKESQLQALIDATPGYISWFDENLKYIGVNEKLANDFKLSREDFVGKELGFLEQKTQQNFSDEVRKFFKEDLQVKQVEIFISFELSPVVKRKFLVCMEKFNKNKNIVVVGIDMTEKWLIEINSIRDRENMINSSRLASIGQMAGSIAHEINNPLTIIQGFAFKIKRQLQKELSPEKFIEQYENHFQSINNTIIRISKIISGLRNISRDGANDPMEKTSLENIIQEILSISLQKFKNNNVSLSYEQKNKEIMVSCRHVQIGQVLLNLLNNAYDAVLHTQEAWVKIQVTETDQEVELSITDSGKGIPEDIVEKMLTPFYTSKPVGKGTGLGLSIAKKIIEQHSGVFYYDELSENTRFVIVLPKCEGRELVA